MVKKKAEKGDTTREPLLQDSAGPGAYGTSTSNNTGEFSAEYLALVVSQQQHSVVLGNGVEKLAQQVGCASIQDGLPTSQVSSQRAKYGSNQVSLPPKPSLLSLILEETKDPTILMLIGSAVVSLLLAAWEDEENGWIEGTSILVTVCLVVSLSAGTDYLKARQFRQQQVDLESAQHVWVVRDSTLLKIHPRDLVVGDVVRLAVGDICPVDGVLVDGIVKMDESALTGETKLIPKSVNVDPFIISGTNVMQGEGKLLVLAVGGNSMQGKILQRIREQEEKREEEEAFSCSNLCSFGAGDDGAGLMEKLDILAVDIGKIGLMVAFGVFFVLLFSWTHVQFVEDTQCGPQGTEEECEVRVACAWMETTCQRVWVTQDLSTILEFFITGVTILVVAVPEGLPLAVTLALAVSIRRMIQDNNQVKHMDSCETMGSATTICSDKTGTLTENKMTVMRAHVAGQDYAHIIGRDSHDSLGAMMQGNGTMTRLLSESILLNCNPTSKVVETETGTKYEGNATECALIKLTMQLGYQADAVRKAFKEKDSLLEWGVYNIPFSSERKLMFWVVRGNSPRTFRLYCKGAPKEALALCDFFVSRIDNKVEVLPPTVEDRARVLKVAESYQKDGLRTIAIAYRDFSAEPRGGWSNSSDLERSLTFLAIFGIEDPLRPSVPGAIADCRKAGIDVRMLTGDALVTAIAIAKGCGILRSQDLDENGYPKKNFAMTGAEFDDLVHMKDPDKPQVLRRVFDPEVNDAVNKLADPFKFDKSGNKILDQAAFDRVWPTLRVLARCQPEDKLALVRGMRRSKVFMDKGRCAELRIKHGISIFPDYQVVAVTGDGTNDAPALKSADVGFAMGIVGTETAKQACDIILLDDNFASIVKAAMWGRNVFDSISKFLQFQLTVNVVAISLAVLGAFLYAESPLSAVQMLWVNMVMDSLASLALATELPTKELLDRMPYGKRRPIISNIMASNIAGQALFQIGILCWVLFAPQTLPIIDPPILFEPYQGSLHWSLFFNVFVMLQLFNEFNSRKFQTVEKLRTTWSEWNVFDGCLRNHIFVLVMVGTFSVQIILVQFGGIAVNLISGGLTRNQWAFCVAAGASGLLWQFVINAFVCLWFPPSDEREAKFIEETQRKLLPPDEELAERQANAAKNWDIVRLGVRQGFVYSRMFSTSFDSGFRIANLCDTKCESARRSALIRKEVLRESMSVRSSPAELQVCYEE